MKNLRIVAFIVLSCTFFSVTAMLGQSKWRPRIANSVDVVLGGDIGFRLLSTSNPDLEYQVRNRKTAESFKFNYRAGLNFNIGLTGSLAIKTGIRFSNPGYSISRVEQIDFTQDINEVVKMVPSTNNSESAYRYKVHHNLTQVPIGIKYVAQGGFCEPYFELGVIPSFYGVTRISGFDVNGNKTDVKIEENINKVNFISFIGVGGNYRISSNLSAFTQISANYQLNNLRIDAVNEKLVGLGFEVGLRQYL